MNKNSKTVTAFIDGSNVFHAQRANRWQIDFAKLAAYIDSYGECLGKYYFTPRPSYKDAAAINNYLAFKKMLIANGYTVKDKEVKEINTKDNFGRAVKLKGNLDVEMGYWMTKVYDGYEISIIITGDSDYECILESMVLNGKYVIVIGNKDNTSLELHNMAHKFIDLNSLRNQLEYKNK